MIEVLTNMRLDLYTLGTHGGEKNGNAGCPTPRRNGCKRPNTAKNISHIIGRHPFNIITEEIYD